MWSSGSSGRMWSFDALFPEPQWDEEIVKKDLYGISERDDLLISSKTGQGKNITNKEVKNDDDMRNKSVEVDGQIVSNINEEININATVDKEGNETIDHTLTQMVEERIYETRLTDEGTYVTDNSLLDRDSAVQFRDGVRLGNPLKVNADKLTYYAKKELSRNKLDEAYDLYERALKIDPKDGRAYLGLSRIAQRKKKLKLAREWLREGLKNSYTLEERLNPFLLQALGCLEERAGHLSQAEALFIEAVKIRPYHAASWVSLAQLRVHKLRLGAEAGRICYVTATKEIEIANKKPSSYVYTAWAQNEYEEANDHKRARDLFRKALEIDPRSSVAWLKLGKMEADRRNYAEAQQCFESALKYDKFNSRILQAYAIMESKRPGGNSRDVIDLFERALKAKPKDAGVLQAYALYVANLVGDIDAARNLLLRGTKANKHHAPVWQAWGVLETRYGTPQAARNIFQQGIWSCAQSGGGQSGGRACARLWQAWGVLEAREGDTDAARRCFSRALDADSRNVAAVTAWARMEEKLENYIDAKSIYERALKQLPPQTTERKSLWKSYENMEIRLNNPKLAQDVYLRSIMNNYRKQPISVTQRYLELKALTETKNQTSSTTSLDDDQIEVLRFTKRNKKAKFRDGEVWINDGSIEGKLSLSKMKQKFSTTTNNHKKK